MTQNNDKTSLTEAKGAPDRFLTVHARKIDGTFEEESRLSGSKKYSVDLRDGSARPIKPRKPRQKSLEKVIDKKPQTINLAANIQNFNQINLIANTANTVDNVI
jgi:hypothetical protein